MCVNEKNIYRSIFYTPLDHVFIIIMKAVSADAKNGKNKCEYDARSMY